jgi:hypothetical protein
MSEHWQLFLALLTVMGIWGALLVTVFQIMLSRVMKAQTETIQTKIGVIQTVETNCARLERELLQLKADLPEKYVRREDFIRFDVGINDKLDKLRDLFLEKLENLEK